MNAHRLIEDVRAAGISIEVDGGDLIVEADRDPPPELVAELRAHKAEVIAFLTNRGQPDADDLAERAAIHDAGVPRRWAEGYAALSTMPAPTGFTSPRWQRIIDAAGVFLDRWANEAVRCGWSDVDLFGVNPDRPDARFDAMGLVLLLDRCKVVGIDEGGADLVTTTGDPQRYRRRPLPADTVSLWELTP
jgi:hypothetical protein